MTDKKPNLIELISGFAGCGGCIVAIAIPITIIWLLFAFVFPSLGNWIIDVIAAIKA